MDALVTADAHGCGVDKGDVRAPVQKGVPFYRLVEKDCIFDPSKSEC